METFAAAMPKPGMEENDGVGALSSDSRIVRLKDQHSKLAGGSGKSAGDDTVVSSPDGGDQLTMNEIAVKLNAAATRWADNMVTFRLAAHTISDLCGEGLEGSETNL
jgi:hypothetical protein